jgi:hypothetical protein
MALNLPQHLGQFVIVAVEMSVSVDEHERLWVEWPRSLRQAPAQGNGPGRTTTQSCLEALRARPHGTACGWVSSVIDRSQPDRAPSPGTSDATDERRWDTQDALERFLRIVGMRHGLTDQLVVLWGQLLVQVGMM